MTEVVIVQGEYTPEYVVKDGVVEATIRWPSPATLKGMLDAALDGRLLAWWEAYLGEQHTVSTNGNFEWFLTKLVPERVNWKKVDDPLVEAFEMNREAGSQVYYVGRSLTSAPSSGCRVGFMVWLPETKRAHLMFDGSSDLSTFTGETPYIAFMDWMNFNNR
jgi:hypothetical protein